MKLPSNISEAQFVDAVKRICQNIARNYVFGPFTLEDIKQQAFVLAIEALPRYDVSRPLENFLYVHICNRLNNLRRDFYKQTEAPCKLCDNRMDGDTAHTDSRFCDQHRQWLVKNSRKHRVVQPADITVSDSSSYAASDNVLEKLEQEELLVKIDKFLPVEHRSAYLKLREGVALPKAKLEELLAVLRKVLS